MDGKYLDTVDKSDEPKPAVLFNLIHFAPPLDAKVGMLTPKLAKTGSNC